MTESQFILATAVACLLFAGLIVGVIVQGRRRKNQQNQPPVEQAAREQATVAPATPPTRPIKPVHNPSTATVSASPDTANTIVDLSNSGAVTIQAEIDRCLSSKSWDEAAKWAVHAINAMPDEDKLKVTLAEIHARAGNVEKFTPMLEILQPKLLGDQTQHDRLLALATDVVPEHPLVQTMKDHNFSA